MLEWKSLVLWWYRLKCRRMRDLVRPRPADSASRRADGSRVAARLAASATSTARPARRRVEECGTCSLCCEVRSLMGPWRGGASTAALEAAWAASGRWSCSQGLSGASFLVSGHGHPSPASIIHPRQTSRSFDRKLCSFGRNKSREMKGAESSWATQTKSMITFESATLEIIQWKIGGFNVSQNKDDIKSFRNRKRNPEPSTKWNIHYRRQAIRYWRGYHSRKRFYWHEND